MKLSHIVRQVMENGYLAPELETEVMRFCHHSYALSTEEDFYLNQLMGAVLNGRVRGLLIW